MVEEYHKSNDSCMDAKLIAKLEQEFSDYKNGKVKALPFNEVRKNAKEAIRKIKGQKLA